jgi:hypothetical protein
MRTDSASAASSTAQADRYNQASSTATAPRVPNVAWSRSALVAAAAINTVPPTQIVLPISTAMWRAGTDAA